MSDDLMLWQLMMAIASADSGGASDLLAVNPGLATAALQDGATRQSAATDF